MFIRTEGERARSTAIAALGLAGACLGLGALGKLHTGASTGAVGPLWLAAAGAAGALIAAPFAAHHVTRGPARAIVAGVAFALMLGVIGGSMVLPVFGTMFGPFLIVGTVFSAPWLHLPLVLALIGLARAQRRLEAERDTLHVWAEARGL
ncbi:MAG: hypothetical protein ACU0CO_02330 [Shimia sp.]